MIYKLHGGPVRCLHWFDDDSGFISGGWDGNVFCWDLFPDKSREDKEVDGPYMIYSLKNFQFACVANHPDSKTKIYAAGIDKTIKTIEMVEEKDKKHERKTELMMTYEAGVNIS
jgi:WD40 repeat protein